MRPSWAVRRMPGTTKAVRPAQQHQIIAAGLVGSEPTLEFGQIARIILHDP